MTETELKPALGSVVKPLAVIVDSRVWLDSDASDLDRLRNHRLTQDVPIIHIRKETDLLDSPLISDVTKKFNESQVDELRAYVQELKTKRDTMVKEQSWLFGNILVVEDDQLVGRLIETMLSSRGHHLRWIQNGCSLDAALDRQQPDVILMDLNLPDCSGFDLIEKLKRSDRFGHLPIIVSSGQSGRATVLKALTLGADDYVTKPFDPAELNARVCNLVKVKKITDMIRRTRDFWRYRNELTGLPNLRALESELQLLLGSRQAVAVVMVEVDQFSRIYHRMGGRVSDSILLWVAEILDKALPSAELVSHIDQDRFVVVIKTDSSEHVDLITQIIAKEFERPFFASASEMRLTVSIGACLAPLQSDSAASAIRYASIALEEAICGGGNQAQIYSSAVDEQRVRELVLETELTHAIENGELLLLFQPKVEISTSKIVGVEALVRWQHPVHGMIAPKVMIPLAERSSTIIEVGKWVLEEACRFWIKCSEANHKSIRIAVNLSPRQFRCPTLIEDMAGITSKFNVPNNAIEFEITESCSIDDPAITTQILTRLKQRGFGLAIDDFGTGYSSLSYLTSFPLDTLKVDRSFVTDIPDSPSASTVAKAIVSIAHSLKMNCVAEGIETKEQLDFLEGIGCSIGQGNFFSRPQAAEKILALLD